MAGSGAAEAAPGRSGYEGVPPRPPLAMELGARFRAYSLQQGCVPVRSHNRQHGTAIRRDVRFMQEKFGCAQILKRSENRKKKQPSLCPAYFVLQHKEDTDHLVISQVNSHETAP